jgi:hypothetical protein
MSKTKVLGMEYGIEITRPWSPEMYEHNDKVMATMKEAIFVVLSRAYTDDNEEDLRQIAKFICGYGFAGSVDMDAIHEDACRQLDMTAGHWMNSDLWPDMVMEGFVKDLDVKLVGYSK